MEEIHGYSEIVGHLSVLLSKCNNSQLSIYVQYSSQVPILTQAVLLGLIIQM